MTGGPRRTLTPAELEQRAQANVRHGARSEGTVTRRRGYEKQRVMQRLGIRQADLDSPTRYLLDQWATASAQTWLMDKYVDCHGLLGPDGKPWAFSATHAAARNSAARLFAKLEPRLLAAAEVKHLGGDPVAVLAAAGRAALEARGNGGGAK